MYIVWFLFSRYRSGAACSVGWSRPCSPCPHRLSGTRHFHSLIVLLVLSCMEMPAVVMNHRHHNLWGSGRSKQIRVQTLSQEGSSRYQRQVHVICSVVNSFPSQGNPRWFSILNWCIADVIVIVTVWVAVSERGFAIPSVSEANIWQPTQWDLCCTSLNLNLNYECI